MIFVSEASSTHGDIKQRVWLVIVIFLEASNHRPPIFSENLLTAQNPRSGTKTLHIEQKNEESNGEQVKSEQIQLIEKEQRGSGGPTSPLPSDFVSIGIAGCL